MAEQSPTEEVTESSILQYKDKHIPSRKDLSQLKIGGITKGDHSQETNREAEVAAEAEEIISPKNSEAIRINTLQGSSETNKVRNPLKRVPMILDSLNPFKKRLSEEEVAKIFKEAEVYQHESQIQSQIKEKLKSWVDSVMPSIQERADKLGLGKDSIGRLEQDLMNSFNWDLIDIRDPKKLTELKIKAALEIQKLQDQELKPQLETAINSSTSLSILELINKKIDGQDLTKSEALLLETLLVAREGDHRTGEHDPLLEKVRIPLLGSNNLNKYTATVHHEFTHFALNKIVPILGIELMRSVGKMTGQSNNPQALFLKIATAINESCAHQAGKFFGGHEPYFEGYGTKTHPLLFKQTYETVGNIAKEKTLEEFDQATVKFYKHFISQWQDNLTMPQLLEAVRSTFSFGASELTRKPPA